MFCLVSQHSVEWVDCDFFRRVKQAEEPLVFLLSLGNMVVVVTGSLQSVMSIENVYTVDFGKELNELSTLVHFPEGMTPTVHRSPLAIRLISLDVIMEQVSYATLFFSETENDWSNMVQPVAFMVVAWSAQSPLMDLHHTLFVVLDA